MAQHSVNHELKPLLAADPSPTHNYASSSNSNTGPPSSSVNRGKASGRAEPNRAVIGAAYIIVSSIAFATTDTLTRALTSRASLPVPTALFVKSVIYMLATGVYTYFFIPLSTLRSLSRLQINALASFCAIFAIYVLCLFRALDSLPAGDVTAITFANPAITIVLSTLVLHEPFGCSDAAVVASSLVGLYFVAGDSIISTSTSGNSGALWGYAYAFGTTVLCSLSIVANRRMGDVPCTFVVFVLSFFLLPIAVLSGGAVTPGQLWAYGPITVANSVGCSFAAIVITAMCVKGYQLCPPGPGAILHTLTVPFAYVQGALLLGEMPQWKQSFGATLIIAGTLVIGADLMRKKDTNDKPGANVQQEMEEMEEVEEVGGIV